MNRKQYGLIALVFMAASYGAEKLSVVAEGAKVEKLAGGFKFTEGPALMRRAISSLPIFRIIEFTNGHWTGS